MYTFGPQPQVLAIVHATGDRGLPDLLLWQAAFNLTIAEAQVALMLTRGHSTNEIATHRCVAVATVRTQLKALLQKTAVSRQSALVAQLMSVGALP